MTSRTLAVSLPTALLGLLACLPGGANAAVSTFGSSLTVPATENTANNLNYAGTNIPTIFNGQGVVVHVSHDGADTALWNSSLASGSAAAPAGGQIVQVRLEGCAQPAPNGPSPLTQIHFQDLAPQGGGAVKVGVTTNPFSIPVCGQNGASISTVSSFTPTNFCVNAGDFVGFNDEGGFDSHAYPSGVPYAVIGAVPGSTMDSFIRNNGTGNGSTFSPGDTSYHDGFAVNSDHELLLAATLATGSDATPLCPGGSAGQKPPSPVSAAPAPARASTSRHASASIPRQTDGASRAGALSVAVACHDTGISCQGTLVVKMGRATRSARFALPSAKTGHVKLVFGRALHRTLRLTHGQRDGQVTLTLLNSGPRRFTLTVKG